MQYVIVRIKPDSDFAVVQTVFGPFDQQGCTAAYRVLRRDLHADQHLVVRALLPVASEAPTVPA